MSIIRMRAPEGMSSFSHQGHPQDLDREGHVLVDERHAADFVVHGFTLASERRNSAQGLAADRIFAADPRPDAREAPVPAAPASDLAPGTIAFLNRLSATPGSLDRLAAMLERETAGQPDPRAAADPVSPAPEETADPVSLDGRLTEDQIDRMTKAQCQAWCKANDVPAVPPIDLDVLRAKIKAKQG